MIHRCDKKENLQQFLNKKMKIITNFNLDIINFYDIRTFGSIGYERNQLFSK